MRVFLKEELILSFDEHILKFVEAGKKQRAMAKALYASSEDVFNNPSASEREADKEAAERENAIADKMLGQYHEMVKMRNRFMNLSNVSHAKPPRVK